MSAASINFTMFIDGTILILFYLHGACSQGERICSSLEMRTAAMYKELAAVGCNNYSCALQKQTIGHSADHPAVSCAELLQINIQTPSGYYWLRSSNGSAVYVYCNMTLTCKGVSGGWIQVVKLDMTSSSQQCPLGTTLRTDLPKRLCGILISGEGCSSTMFNTYGIEYSQVCGKIIGYQDQTPDAFSQGTSQTIDGNYVEGISLTHGRNPRKHVWTFSAALHEIGNELPAFNCPCINRNFSSSATPPPCFVGNDYFCDTGSAERVCFIFYGDDPLWDGAGCGPLNDCCALNNPPWFLKRLPFPTSDDIEMRFCRSLVDHEDTPVEIIEIYVQ